LKTKIYFEAIPIDSFYKVLLIIVIQLEVINKIFKVVCY